MLPLRADRWRRHLSLYRALPQWSKSSMMSTARRAPHAPAASGSTLHDVETPALLVDMDALEGNMSTMKGMMAKFPNVTVRPHGKTHKTLEIAAMQMAQPQTSGICCQKVSEAVALVDGVGDVLLTSGLVSPVKARRLAALARRGCSITVVVDSALSAEVLALAARSEGVRLSVLIDINVGQNRCGVDSASEAIEVARVVADLQELDFRGIQAYHGRIQHLREYAKRSAEAASVANRARQVATALADAGFPCDTITGGGTGTFEFDAAGGVFTEVQPGSYIFGDVDYSANLGEDDRPIGLWRQSLFVAATVISRNEAGNRVVLDAGMKAVSYDSGPPVLHGFSSGSFRIENGGDEHTVVHFGPDVSLPSLGEPLLLVPGHCDPTVNLHDFLVAMRKDHVEAVLSISGRSPGL